MKRAGNYKASPIGFYRIHVAFYYQEVFDALATISYPVWTVEQEAGRRKKTIYGTCPNCLWINKLDRRKIHDSGRFMAPGCFICTKCGFSFRPELIGWKAKYLVSTHKSRRLKA